MPELRPRRSRSASPAARRIWPRHAPRRESDVDTQVQEELSAEVVALSDAVLTLLWDRGDVEASDLTEEVILEATEMILFATMNCAHVVTDSVLRARVGKGRQRHSAVATDRRFMT